jgi:hypothetical protein
MLWSETILWCRCWNSFHHGFLHCLFFAALVVNECLVAAGIGFLLIFLHRRHPPQPNQPGLSVGVHVMAECLCSLKTFFGDPG